MSQSVSHWQVFPMIGLGSDKNQDDLLGANSDAVCSSTTGHYERRWWKSDQKKYWNIFISVKLSGRMFSIFVEEESYKGISEYIHLKLNGTYGVNTWLYSNICHNLLQIQLIECVPLQVCQTNIRREKVRGVVRQSPPDRLSQDRRGNSNTCNR